jgi:hypothetical protein
LCISNLGSINSKEFDTVKTSTRLSLIKESKSAKVVGALRKEEGLSDSETIINAKIPINDCHLWSPEDPFFIYFGSNH